MKLRNKKTGEIWETAVVNSYACGVGYRLLVTKDAYTQVGKHYDSLAELNAEWEDYKPAEPLIKDEEIRKAVRAWAEANNVPTDVELDVFEYLGTGVTAIRYLYKAKTLPYERCVQFEYISSDEIYNSQNNREHTITELCGEEE